MVSRRKGLELVLGRPPTMMWQLSVLWQTHHGIMVSFSVTRCHCALASAKLYCL